MHKKETPGPLVSFIIVNLNGEKFLYKNLSSVFSQRSRCAFEVIGVDNGSKDGSVNIIRENFPQARVIENKENLGFAKGNNQGLEASRGEFVITLNNDTELAEGFLEELLRDAEASDEDVGMWAPKILSIEDPRVIDSVGGLLIYPDGLAKGRGRLDRDNGQYDNEKEVFIPSACAALFRRAMLDEVGFFDEDFFAYCEDTDLGLRARLAGWKTRSVPGAVVYHHYSATGGRYTPFKVFLVERNHLWAAIKNFPLSMLALLPFYELWRYVVEAWGILTKRGAGARFAEGFSGARLIPIVIRAYLSALKGMPSILRKRSAIQRKRAVTNNEIREWFRKYRLSAARLVLRD